MLELLEVEVQLPHKKFARSPPDVVGCLRIQNLQRPSLPSARAALSVYPKEPHRCDFVWDVCHS